jgi:AraC-like DNA-binding protein
MNSPRSLYETAAICGYPNALLHVGERNMCYVGTLDYVAPHHHGAPVLTVGLYGSFEIRVAGGAWATCRTAIVPAGVRYELDSHGEPLGEYYPEPNRAPQSALSPLLRNAKERDGIISSQSNGLSLMRELYEDRGSHMWVAEAIGTLLDRCERKAEADGIDPRLTAVISYLQQYPDDQTSVEQLARANNLSASRFRHLFSEQIGTSYRRYRMWNRLRAAISRAVSGATLTDAALAVGFSDSAHFSHNFQDTFGVTPSYVMRRIARVG